MTGIYFVAAGTISRTAPNTRGCRERAARERGELARELVELERFEIPAGEVEESEGGL
jgi:hypothetical protein